MPRKKAAGATGHRVIRTKLRPPRAARRVVRRERALQLLALGVERALTLLRAPAGFGKTTVLADWCGQLQAGRHLVAWVTLDEDDNDTSSFVTYVIRALGDALGSLADHVPELRADPESAAPKVKLTSAINALESIDVPVVLVLDDYDRIHASAIHDLLSFLLLHAPSSLHVVIAARGEPPLPLAYLRAHDDLVEIDASHLRFDLDDARRFFGEVAALELDAGQSRALHDATEGWVAGMQIAAISLRDHGDADRLISGFGGKFRAIDEYLGQAVLAHLDEGTIGFLLRIAILERFDGSVCEAVTGVADGSALLAQLHQQSYFLQSLDDEQLWYRYHALFRDFLRGELLRRMPAEIAPLHERAAGWFAEHHLWAEAVRHALAAERIDLATQWVEHCAMREVEDSRVHTLLAWVRKLPEQAIRSRQRLRLAVAWALLLTIQLDEAMAVVDDLCSQQEQGAFPPSRAVESELLALRFCITALKDDTAVALPIGERFLERLRLGMRGEECAVWTVQATLNGLTFCYQKAGRVEEARAMQQPGLYPVSRDSSRNLFTQCYRAGTLGSCDLRQFRLFEAARQWREALQLAERHAGRRSAAATLVACPLAALHYEWNELDEAEQLLSDRFDIVDEACYLDSVQAAYLAMSRLAIARGDCGAAHRLLDRGELVAHRRGWQRLTAVCLAERVTLYLRENHSLEAQAVCERLARLAPPAAPRIACALSEIWRVAQLAHARCLLHDGQAAKVAALLQPVLEDEEAECSPYTGARTRMLLSVALERGGRHDEARQVLSALLDMAARSGMVRSIADEGLRAAPLLRELSSRLVTASPAAARWRDTLFVAMGLDAAPSGKPHPAQTLIEPLSPRERDVLTLVARGLSNEQAARALQLGVETVKWHLKNVYSKLGVSRRILAVQRARQMDLITDDAPHG